jgi:diadenosine tetraphosphate (Ap4A) HIT family hydrolase
MNDACPFCAPDSARVFHEGGRVLGLWDGFPVTPGHALLVPRRHVTVWEETDLAERGELVEAVGIAQTAIRARHAPDGFNLGMNLGAAAG